MKLKKIFSSVLLTLAIVSSLSITASAASNTESFRVGFNQYWNTRVAVSRSGNYSYASAKLYSNTPVDGGYDSLTGAQVTLYAENSSTQISGTYTLYESNSSNTSLSIAEGYLNEDAVRFAFRSCDSSTDGYIRVYYSGN